MTKLRVTGGKKKKKDPACWNLCCNLRIKSHTSGKHQYQSWFGVEDKVLEATVWQSGFPSAVSNYIGRSPQLCHLQGSTFKKLQVRNVFLNLFIYTLIGKARIYEAPTGKEHCASYREKQQISLSKISKAKEEKSLQKLKYVVSAFLENT